MTYIYHYIRACMALHTGMHGNTTFSIVIEYFTDSTYKEKECGHLGKVALDSSVMKETAAESKIKRMKLDTLWLTAVKYSLLEFYSD